MRSVYSAICVEYPFEITSNHNSSLPVSTITKLNILLKLHQTTTWLRTNGLLFWLNILLKLHQTTTIPHVWHLLQLLNILLKLHQTTTIALKHNRYSQLNILLKLHQTTTHQRTTKSL